MKELKGSAKQIAWAEEIRSNTFKVLDWLDGKFADRLYGPSDLNYVSREAVSALRAEYTALFDKIDSASFIIDKRNHFTSDSIIKHGRDWMRFHKK